MPGTPSFKANLITPEAILLETTVTKAQLPAFDGLLGILDKRAPLLAKLGTGVLRLTTSSGEEQRFLVAGGYARMFDGELTILTSEALSSSQITSDTIAQEESRLNAISGDSLAAMDQRQAVQLRLRAMR